VIIPKHVNVETGFLNDVNFHKFDAFAWMHVRFIPFVDSAREFVPVIARGYFIEEREEMEIKGRKERRKRKKLKQGEK
jgi:hypothetical protein